MSNKKTISTDFSLFNPRRYLDEYYSNVGKENKELLFFFHHAYEKIFSNLKETANVKLLELGGGPTLYQLISASKHPVEIHFSDYVTENILEIEKWLKKHPERFDWKNFIATTLEIEEQQLTNENIKKREDEISLKIKKTSTCDVRQLNPLGDDIKEKFDILAINMVLESITSSKQDWKNTMKNAVSLSKQGGYLVMTAIIGAKYYHLGEHRFPATPVSKRAITQELKSNGFDTIFTHFVEAESKQGYKGIFMLVAKNNA